MLSKAFGMNGSKTAKSVRLNLILTEANKRHYTNFKKIPVMMWRKPF